MGCKGLELWQGGNGKRQRDGDGDDVVEVGEPPS